jgi:SAM-dependent methyltransferase
VVAPPVARYDGHADWYDEVFSAFASGEDAVYVRQAIGPGDGGVCLDVACGTGLRAQPVRDAGWSPVGFDISTDQLRLARNRLGGVALADARFLPVRDESVAVALGAYFHTDVEDFASVVADIARCLRRGGRFVYVGLHPCFIGPFVDRSNEGQEETLTFTSGYGNNGWARRGSGDGTGTWARVGGHHKTLGSFLEAFAKAPLRVRAVDELSGGGVVLPRNLAVIAEKNGP